MPRRCGVDQRCAGAMLRRAARTGSALCRAAGRVVLPNCAWEKTSHSKNNLGQNGLQAARVRGGQQKHVRKGSSTSAPHFRRVVAKSSSAHANAGVWQRVAALMGDAAILRRRPDLPQFLKGVCQGVPRILILKSQIQKIWLA